MLQSLTFRELEALLALALPGFYVQLDLGSLLQQTCSFLTQDGTRD